MDQEESRLDAALAYFENQDWVTALELLTALLEVETIRERVSPYYFRALVYAGKTEEAESGLRHRIRQMEATEDEWSLLGTLLYRDGRFEEASEVYSHLCKLYPSRIDNVLNFAASLERQGRINEARHYLEKYLSERPDETVVQFTYTRLVYKMDGIEGVLERYNGTGAMDRYCRGIAFWANHDIESAFSELSRAAVEEPRNARFQCMLGQLFCQRQLFDEAMMCFKEAVLLDDTYVDAHYAHGWCCDYKGENDDAKDAYRHVIKKDPFNAAAMIRLGCIYFREENYAEAIALWKHVLLLGSEGEIAEAKELLSSFKTM